MIHETNVHEPLLPALGGDPIGLKEHIENELDKWEAHQMKPLFVFEGQSMVGKDDITLRRSKAALAKTQDAWDLYNDNHPEEAVKAFGASGTRSRVIREMGLTYYRGCSSGKSVPDSTRSTS